MSIKTQFTLTGEFIDQSEEHRFLNSQWESNRTFYFLSYIICCFLLLLAGLVVDYSRDYVWGSANALSMLRLGLVTASLLLIPLYKGSTSFPRTFPFYALFLTVYSSIIILLLNLMTGGQSLTLLPGILIITVSFYVVLPNSTYFSMIPALIQVINFLFFYDTSTVGLGSHLYMSFMVVSINIVMFIFKVMHNKTSRTTFIMMEQHKESAEAKNTILGIIGHDLKNPLTVINLKVSLAQILLERGHIDKVSKELNKVEIATNKLQELLQSLLNWASSESQLQQKSVNSIEACFEKSIEHCSNMAKQKELKLIRNIEDENFNFNVNMVETIIRNILVNAIKFTDVGREIYVSGKKIESTYELIVTDQGIGMSEEQINLILTGKNLNSTEGTDGEKGTGLGLQLTHEFIKNHNAIFNIESQLGIGTSFIVKFPIS